LYAAASFFLCQYSSTNRAFSAASDAFSLEEYVVAHPPNGEYPKQGIYLSSSA